MTTVKVYDVLAAVAAREGIEQIFTVMGDANKLWLAQIESHHPSIKVRYTRHESAAVAMADGYARATGKLGVCSVTAGPGLAFTATSLVTAQRHGSPVLLFAGDVPLGDQTNVQRIDQRRFVETLGVTSRTLVRADTAAEDFSWACDVARTQGAPVVLSVPTDVQEREYGWDLDDTPPPSRAPSTSVAPDPAGIERAVAALRGAERPVILAGRGASDAATRDALVEIAERTGALLATTLLGQGLFAGQPFDLGVAGLFSNDVTQRAFAGADLVLAVGASLNHYTTEGGVLFPGATLIHVDRKPFALRDGYKIADHYLQADALAAVTELVRRLRQDDVRRTGYRDADMRAAIAGVHAARAAGYGGPATAEDGKLDPRAVMSAVAASLTGDELLVIGMGHFWWHPIRYLRHTPGRSFYTHDFGSIGQALPTGIGIAAGRPGERVVVVEGDASILMCIQELDTAARYGLSPLVLVMNDEGVGAEYHRLNAHGLDGRPAIIPSPDLAAVARGFGAAGHTVRTPEDLRHALAAAAGHDGPCLLDIRISREHLAEPYERLWYPAGRS